MLGGRSMDCQTRSWSWTPTHCHKLPGLGLLHSATNFMVHPSWPRTSIHAPRQTNSISQHGLQLVLLFCCIVLPPPFHSSLCLRANPIWVPCGTQIGCTGHWAWALGWKWDGGMLHENGVPLQTWAHKCFIGKGSRKQITAMHQLVPHAPSASSRPRSAQQASHIKFRRRGN